MEKSSDNLEHAPTVDMELGNFEETDELPVATNEVTVVRNTGPVPTSISPTPTADDPAPNATATTRRPTY